MKINWNQRIIISQRSTQLCPLLQWNQIISHFAAISCLRVFHFLPDCFLHKNDCHHRIHARQWMTSRLEIIQGHSKLGLAGDCLLTRRFRHWEICAKRYWCLAHRIAHRTALHHTSIWICQKTKDKSSQDNMLNPFLEKRKWDGEELNWGKVKATKEQCFERKKKKKRYKGTKVQRYKGTNQQILLDMDPSFEKHALCPMSPLCDPMRTLPMPCILPCLQCLQPLISNSQLPFLFFSFSSFLFLLSQLKDHLNWMNELTNLPFKCPVCRAVFSFIFPFLSCAKQERRRKEDRVNLLQGAEENNKGNKFQHVTLSPSYSYQKEKNNCFHSCDGQKSIEWPKKKKQLFIACIEINYVIWKK